LVDTAVNFHRGGVSAGKSYGIGSANDYVNRWVGTGRADELGDIGAFEVASSKDRVEISLKVYAICGRQLTRPG
jgi:hypothetical protein